jgi:hypothetical protein
VDARTLSAAERRLYHETMRGGHHRRIELEVYRRSDGKAAFSITRDQFLGGSVQGDANRTPVEVLECEVLDDDYTLDWTNGEHRKYRLRVIDARFVPDLDDWVEEAVFTGPLWDFERNGHIVRLVAEGSELDAMGSIREADFWPARSKATDVLKALLRKAGATNGDMRIPNLKRTLPKSVTVGVQIGKDRNKDKRGFQGPVKQRLRVNREDTYYGAAAPIAEALDRDLYTDGLGRFVMESPKSRPSLRLEESDLLAPVTARRGDEGEVTNVWIVEGRNPKGPKGQVRARVELPKKHPSSAFSLRWNGTGRQIIETIENEHLKTKKQALALGRRRRDRGMRELVEYEATALPFLAYFRPGSLMSVPVNGGRATARITRWTRPLGPGADGLTLGATRRRGA